MLFCIITNDIIDTFYILVLHTVLYIYILKFDSDYCFCAQYLTAPSACICVVLKFISCSSGLAIWLLCRLEQ